MQDTFGSRGELTSIMFSDRDSQDRRPAEVNTQTKGMISILVTNENLKSNPRPPSVRTIDKPLSGLR